MCFLKDLPCSKLSKAKARVIKEWADIEPISICVCLIVFIKFSVNKKKSCLACFSRFFLLHVNLLMEG